MELGCLKLDSAVLVSYVPRTLHFWHLPCRFVMRPLTTMADQQSGASCLAVCIVRHTEQLVALLVSERTRCCCGESYSCSPVCALHALRSQCCVRWIAGWTAVRTSAFSHFSCVVSHVFLLQSTAGASRLPSWCVSSRFRWRSVMVSGVLSSSV